MTKRRQLYLVVVVLLFFLLVVIYSTNLYFINWLTADQRPSVANDLPDRQVKSSIQRSINNRSGSRDDSLMRLVYDSSTKFNRSGGIEAAVGIKVTKLKTVFKNKNPRYYPVKRGLLRSFGAKSFNISNVWKVAGSFPKENEVYPHKDERIGKVVKALQEAEIIRARNTPRGTQLKLLLDLAGRQTVLFKPRWYSRNTTIEGKVYAGKDRHNSEIVAFHLAAVLNLRWTPIVVGRRISLVEIHRLADEDLRQTMIKNGTQQCVYGKCYYCKESEAVCDDSDKGTIEGAVLLVIPGKFTKYRSPWQRTYQDGIAAEWEKTDSYCAKVKEKLPLVRLLDLIDVAIFDFLIQNGDRHHYETRDDRVLLMDNGKGFGNPYKDYFDILAPLYQCCIIRKTTWERLQIFSGGALTETLQELDEIDLLQPLLTKEHYLAIERRLLLLYTTVELCREKYGSKIFK
ncbi:glycosaminoglycan xylosylkinase homolog [Topomyia yanbarensis]|uniref:glycosaminoglycan xylosylkinase homolog n=1 Tax=Topomyia yanbarensis TaxID=2498891 RepID=UPI00273B9A7B|nr:glycosaminoglycan xylosylkinase homolog [Topomyia yanbarensis]XP_058816610.1 glycosaminoglycan xylosylkinase homolog [Topomyia yanbarensis]XP_058816618.1 glycosaminoglycan xylosylkinase homolog [Topomyia yanbarensis]